jgi:hypothetical protein
MLGQLLTSETSFMMLYLPYARSRPQLECLVTATGKEARAAAAANKAEGISIEHHVDIDLTLERSRQDMIIANADIYYHSFARSRSLEGLAYSSLRIIESEGAAEIAGFVGYPQFLPCLKLSWIKAPRSTPETHQLTIERRLYMAYDHMVHSFAHRPFFGVPRI